MEITRFDPHHVTEDDLDRCHAVFGARWGEDRPTEDPITRDAVRRRIQVQPPGAGCPRWAAARVGGKIAAVGDVRAVLGDNAHIALVDVTVDPELRGRGIGTALFRHLVADVDQPVVNAWNVRAEGPGERWASRLGMRRVHTAVYQRADLADLPDPEPAPDGYRLRAWRGAAPDDLVAAYAAARSAIADAPAGDGDYQAPKWTIEQVRDHEARLRGSGFENHVVVAVRGGEVAALTELFLSAHFRHRADQGDTAVVAAHRGLGLGRCVKLHQAALLRAGGTAVELFYTSTAAANVHMRRVNESIGFRDIQTVTILEGRTEDLR